MVAMLTLRYSNVKAALLSQSHTSLYDLQNPSWYNVSIKYLEAKWSCRWAASPICNGLIKVLGKVACMRKCPIATIFVDWSLLVIKKDRKHFRLGGITASAF